VSAGVEFLLQDKLAKAISHRYQAGLYYYHDAGLIKRLYLAYERLIKNTLKYGYMLLKPCRGGVPDKKYIAIIETENQKLAVIRSQLISRDELFDVRDWKVRCGAQLVGNVVLFFALPLALIFYRKYKNAEVAIILGFIDAYLIIKFLNLKEKNYLISNDHAGFPFILSKILSYKNSGGKVDYVAHAPAKLEFPENDFSNIYIWSEREKDIYQQISKNPKVKIHLLNKAEGDKACQEYDYLILLSHPTPLLKIYYLKKKLNGIGAIRFHPSDKAKEKILTPLMNLWGLKVDLSSSGIAAIDKSASVFSAMSSLLLDLNPEQRSRTTCILELGRPWVYYSEELDGLRMVRKVSEI
jgi:hypothetical protein